MSDTNTLFIAASRQKLRFPSERGDLTVEQLWDLPLQAKNGFDLDNVAKAVNAELKSISEESFVATSNNPARARAELQLEVVKYVIAARQQDNQAAEARRLAASQRQVIAGALERKENAELENLSAEELRARLAAIDGAAS
jgi:hypothetical protein